MVELNLKLPASFFEGEEREGYYISPDMKRVWAVLFDLLNEFMRVCRKHDIRWWVDGGTLLGAVRHKGMIPWDDDVDVVMMRDEYERLCRVAESEFSHPYFFQTEETDKGSMRGHAQLRNSLTTGILKAEQDNRFSFNQGIFLDIFPLETIPDDDNLFRRQAERVSHYKEQAVEYRNLSHNYHPVRRKNLWKMAKSSLLHLAERTVMRGKFDYEKPYTKFLEEAQRYNGTQSERVCKMVLCPIKPRRVWQREWFSETVTLPFEMFEVPAPKGYIPLLDKFYGNWHIVKKGTATHGGCVFNTDRPYTEYLK
ncbi:MAG: LicD family protein [Prevotellaceae bacterium]|nr:LicD family protein [Prevotellaceae bacterium]